MKQAVFYVTLNYPSEEEFFQILDCLEQNNIEYVELGIPVNDPYMDGEIVRKSHEYVIKQGFDQNKLMSILNRIHNEYSFKKIIMTYKEGLEAYKILDTMEPLFDGILCVDQLITKEECNEPIQIYNGNQSINEVKKRIKENEMFLYLMSGNGKTGGGGKLPTEYQDMIPILRTHSTLPIFVGFGIQDENDVLEVISNGADGVIIGSNFMKIYEKEGLQGIQLYIEKIKKALSMDREVVTIV